MKVIKFPSIEQYRNIVANINRTHNFVGLDEQGEAIYDPSKPKPKLTATGTVKLHGTHFDTNFNLNDGIWFQSRENIITSQSDNAGSAFFGETKADVFIGLIKMLAEHNNIDLNTHTISIPMEWVGKGIQKGVAINNIDKSAFILAHAKVSPHDETLVNYWIPTLVDNQPLQSPDNRIFNIRAFKTYSIDIDFNYPELAQNTMIEMTLEVEDECPVGKAFGHEGIGEGIVFHFYDEKGNLHMWKSKGEKHAKGSKGKTLKPVDDVKVNKIIDVVNKVTVSWRLDQAFTTACDLLNGGTIDRKNLGTYIRLVINDIIKEESDTIAEAGLEPKDLNAKISEVARQYFFQRELDETGL